ncbi:methyl-accepting chemotaxis protein [Paraglaciecola sp. 25GB23A]|uniref:methyl-accepting chemotaxis protein n=1 Tax=Paraglaciecola sp. 25GB23A TaxID=3156068 RepID=UPI0032AF62C3
MQSTRFAEKQKSQIDLVESRLQLNLPASIWNFQDLQIEAILKSEQQSTDVAMIQLFDKSSSLVSQSPGSQTDNSVKVKLTFVEDDETNDVGYAVVFIDESEINEELSRMAINAMIEGIILILCLIASFFFMFARLVMLPLSKINSALLDISSGQGDLTKRLKVRKQDELGSVASSFNIFVEKIQGLIKTLQFSVERSSSISYDVLQSVEDSKGYLLTQQDETNQVAAAITQMSASSKEIARSVQLTVSAADKASEDAEHVSNIIQASISSIDELSNHLNEATKVVSSLENDVAGIVSVLDVIRGIAEQTNLLALNAAIEAARAGEQGRGFAVVADEVRALASRTQQSTAQIQATIESLQSGAKSAVKVMVDSQDRSKSAVEHAQTSGESIKSILASTEQINGMALQIASAVEEQSTVAADLSNNINRIVSSGHDSLKQLDKMTANSDEMNANSHELKSVAQQFKV